MIRATLRTISLISMQLKTQQGSVSIHYIPYLVQSLLTLKVELTQLDTQESERKGDSMRIAAHAYRTQNILILTQNIWNSKGGIVEAQLKETKAPSDTVSRYTRWKRGTAFLWVQKQTKEFPLAISIWHALETLTRITRQRNRKYSNRKGVKKFICRILLQFLHLNIL